MGKAKLLDLLYGAKPPVSRLSMSHKDVVKRVPNLTEAMKAVQRGEMSVEEYYKLVDALKPVTPYSFVPKPVTAEEALAALKPDQIKTFGRTDLLTPGETILSRLDIPAYSKKGAWVTSQHRHKPPEGAPRTIYTPTMVLEGETKMLPGTGAAKKYAAGESDKSSWATMRGAYKPMSDEDAVAMAQDALMRKDFAQIGYDPERRGHFYDRKTMQPIIGTEEGLIQIGPLVLGKKPIRGNPEDFEYKDGGAVHMQDGGSPLDQFAAKSRGVSSLPGYGEGAQDIQQALAAIQEGPVGRIASGVGELAEGYMSGAGSTDLQKIGQGLSMIPMLGLPATVSKTIKTARVGDAITDSLRAKYPNVDISVAGDNTLYLGKMVVPKEQRNQGIGTQVMNDLVKQADDIGATVTLSPSADFGGNKEKLKEFYKRFGFVQNTGKNKDFAISESMYRTPQENLPTNFSDLGAMATQAYADYKANPNQLNALRYQRIKKAADDAYVKTQATPSKPVVTDEDYRGLHTAPTRASGAPLHALTQTYPDDIYSSRASQYYGHGEPRDAAVVSLAQSFKGRPHQMVTVYRAVPKNAKGGINAGDWVTIDRPYAKSHGESALRGDYKILSKRVRANEIFTNGDSIYEWGYDPVEAIKKAAGGAIHMQDGGDPADQMFNFNPIAAQAARQERMRREAEEAKRYKSVMGTTPQDLLRRVEPPPAEISALPLSKTQTKLDRLARSGLEALGMPRPRAQSVASNVKGAIEMLVPDPERIYREMSEATEERDPAKFALANLEAGLGYMPFAKPALGAAKAIGATALDAGKVAGREALRPIDQAMFGEGPLAGVLSYAAPLQAAPKMQAPVSPLGFYDPVEQAALNIKRKQGPGQAFLNEIKGGEFVNKEFLQSSGLAERLAAMPSTTREEVQSMVKGTGPKVEELVLGNVKSMASEKEQKIAGQLVDSIDKSPDSKIYLKDMQGPVFSDEAIYYLQDGTVKPEQFPEGLQQLARDYQKAHEKTKGTQDIPTKYDREDLVFPGGSNYREVLLKLPSVRPSIKNMSRDEYNRAIQDADQRGLRDYTHSHWGSTPNVVAHIRMNDRTDLDGKKVLFIEELQSDWAQQGRKKGFADKPLTRDDLVATVNNSADRPYWEVRTKDGQFIANTGLGDKEISSQEAIDEALHLVKIRGDKRIPKGPFVTDTNEWVDLGLKNILKRAVDEGYDRVAFINGKQSANRYNLSNHVSTIEWNPPSDRLQQKGADGFVTIYLQNGNPIELPLTREGKVLANTGTQFDGKSLDDIVGKEIAQKVMASPSGALAGEGLSVGGKGMKDFYDHIVPDRLRKLVGKQTQIKHIPVGIRGDVPEYETRLTKRGYQLYDTRNNEFLDMEFGTLDEVDEYLHKLDQQNRPMPQLGFDITPEIREKFSKPIPYKKGGAVSISDNPDVMALEVMMAGGGAGKEALEALAKKVEKRGLVRDPGFKMQPGTNKNLAGKTYVQWKAEQNYKHELEDALAKLNPPPEKKMSIQDLPVGSRLIAIPGDRTQADKILRSVNETPLANEVLLYGGPRFGEGKMAQGKPEFWASNAGAAQGVQNRVDAAAKRAKGQPVIGVYMAMGAEDSDQFAKHFTESLIEQYPFANMTNKQIKNFNEEFRKQFPSFKGVDDAGFVDQVLNNTKMRKAFVNAHLKKENVEKFNIPDGLATRHAITVPELRDVPRGLTGFSLGQMRPGAKLEKQTYTEHPSYDTVIPGEFMGSLQLMQDFQDLFPDSTQRALRTLRNNPLFQGPGGKKPESQLFGTFKMQGGEQEVTQQLIDELTAREELIKKLGILPYKKGGKVKKVKVSNNPDVMRLELLRKKHG